MFKKKILLLLLGIWMVASADAQIIPRSIMAASNDSHCFGEIQLSWTIGETSVLCLKNSTGFITEGFRQPIIVQCTGDEQVSSGLFADQQLKVFPNPTNDIVHVSRIGDIATCNMLILRDKNGRIIQNLDFPFPLKDLELDFSALPPGLYLLSLKCPDKKHIAPYKIIKSN